MKEKYIKEVKKSSFLTNKQKREIIRDIEEIFYSASENGETDKEIASRLGAPSDYISKIVEQLGIEDFKKKRNKTHLLSGFAGLLAIFFMTLYFSAIAIRPPENAIGFAQSSTNIIIEGKINFILLFLIFGIIALCVSLLGIFKIMKMRKKK